MFSNPFKKPKQIKPKDQKALLQILEFIKSTLTDETSFVMSGFESVEKLEEELDELSETVKAGDLNSLEDLNMHFLPTSGFQELALENGWSDEYLELTEKFDQIYDKYK